MYLLAFGVEGLASHLYPAAVDAASFVRMDCIFGFLIFGGGKELFRLN